MGGSRYFASYLLRPIVLLEVGICKHVIGLQRAQIRSAPFHNLAARVARLGGKSGPIWQPTSYATILSHSKIRLSSVEHPSVLQLTHDWLRCFRGVPAPFTLQEPSSPSSGRPLRRRCTDASPSSRTSGRSECCSLSWPPRAGFPIQVGGACPEKRHCVFHSSLTL